MSEEEIIKNANTFISYDVLYGQVAFIEPVFKKYQETMQGLLDLYNKEREKNKELEENLKIATAMLTKGTYPERNEGDNDFCKQFIPKSKIKEKIEEYKKQLDLDNECEIALNSKVMDLEKEIEELKEDNKHQWEERCKLTFKLENSTSNDKIKAILEEYKYTEIGDSEKIIEFYKELQSLLEKE